MIPAKLLIAIRAGRHARRTGRGMTELNQVIEEARERNG
jgi:hypothetical protein